jgi:NAD(P)-dependent dehydrogenase (short-subunit alcohol dehydrogenase family)
MTTIPAPKSILVTGASTGIGKAAVLALLARGFRVFAGIRDEAAATQLRIAAPPASTDRLETLTLDVTDAGQIAATANHLREAVGVQGLWGLFNNAGISVNGPIEHLPIDGLRHQLEVNVIGQVAVTQVLIPLLRLARGRIVTTGSVAGFIALPGLAPYAMSKHAIEAFSDSLRRELHPWGIEVSLLEPGAIATDIWQKGMNDADESLRRWPPQVLEHYGPLIKALRKAATDSARRASPTEVVSRAVVHAFTASRPRTRYCMGRDSGIQKWISRLPDRWADNVLGKALGLGL